MPTPADSEARRYKYPYVASEVLSCDLTQLRDAVFAAPSLIVQLLALLKQPPPLPPVLAGYVGKIITSLQKQGPEQFKKFFEDEMPTEDLLPQLMVHIGSDSILQLLINLCIGEPPVAEPGGPAVLATPRDELADQSWLPHSLLIPAALDALGGGTAGHRRGDRECVGAAVRAAGGVDGAAALPRGGRRRRAPLRRARPRLLGRRGWRAAQPGRPRGRAPIADQAAGGAAAAAGCGADYACIDDSSDAGCAGSIAATAVAYSVEPVYAEPCDGAGAAAAAGTSAAGHSALFEPNGFVLDAGGDSVRLQSVRRSNPAYTLYAGGDPAPAGAPCGAPAPADAVHVAVGPAAINERSET